MVGTWTAAKIGSHVRKTEMRDPRKRPHDEFIYVDVSSVDNRLFRIADASTLKGADAPSRARKVIHKGDVIYATVRPTLKRVAYVPQLYDDQICSTGYCVLRTNESLDSRFLYFWLLTDKVTKKVEGIQRGASYPAIRDSDVKELPISIPPLPEQHRIAAVLSHVQLAIEQQNRLIALTTELKKALMHRLFTEGTRGERQKQTEIGPIPESWEVVEIGEVVEVKGGKRLPRGAKLVANDTGYPYIRVTNFSRFSVDTSALHFVPECVQKQISRYVINKTNVFISIAGSIGISGMIPEHLNGANLTENAARLIPKDPEKLWPRYLMYWLASDYCQNEISAQTVKNAQPKLALARIRLLKIALPSFQEQRDIVAEIDVAGQKTTNAQAKKTQFQDLFRTLLHQLMTAEIRVNDLDLGELGIEINEDQAEAV